MTKAGKTSYTYNPALILQPLVNIHFMMYLIFDMITAGNLQAVGGLLLTGTGLSMVVDAGSKKAKGEKWFWYGTLALIVFQAGLCLVVGSV